MARPHGRSSEEEALLERAMRVLPGGVLGGYDTPQEMAIIDRGAQGARLRADSGRGDIDCVLGGPLMLGHAHPAVVAAVEAQRGKGTTSSQLSEPTLPWPRRSARPSRARSRSASARPERRPPSSRYVTAELIRRGVVKTAQKFYVSLAHGEQDIERTMDAVAGALKTAADQRH